MRTIKIPRAWIEAAISEDTHGTHVLGAVEVNWPELRLTEEQVIANAFARAYGREEPYDDNTIFAVELPRVLVR